VKVVDDDERNSTQWSALSAERSELDHISTSVKVLRPRTVLAQFSTYHKFTAQQDLDCGCLLCCRTSSHWYCSAVSFVVTYPPAVLGAIAASDECAQGIRCCVVRIRATLQFLSPTALGPMGPGAVLEHV